MAVNEGEIVGFPYGVTMVWWESDEFYLHQIGLMQQWRGRGIGRALLVQFAKALVASGFHSFKHLRRENVSTALKVAPYLFHILLIGFAKSFDTLSFLRKDDPMSGDLEEQHHAGEHEGSHKQRHSGKIQKIGSIHRMAGEAVYALCV